jgi:hypothetical protein
VGVGGGFDAGLPCQCVLRGAGFDGCPFGRGRFGGVRPSGGDGEEFAGDVGGIGLPCVNCWLGGILTKKKTKIY